MAELFYLNKTQLIEKLKKITGWRISRMTFWYWDKKFHLVNPIFKTKTACFFTEDELNKVIEKLKQLNNQGLITIKRAI